MIRSWVFDKSRRTHPLNSPSSGKVFAMLAAYMDDSGTHEGSHNCVVAGYWGSVNEWRRFERAWNAVLAQHGISEFKASQFWPRFEGKRLKPYEDWNDEKHTAFIDSLLLIIRDAKIIPFGCGVLGADWNARLPEFRERSTFADSEKQAKSMLLPFQRNIYRAASYCHRGITMHFVFDDSTTTHVKSGILTCYSVIKASAKNVGDALKDHLGGIEFADSCKVAPLQAADLLAYEMHRYAKQKVRDLAHMRFEYKRALVRMKSREDFWLFDGIRLERLEKILVPETAE